ncbi:MAG: alpha/beta fold hydrolase, partial [Gammaproteobacteria bacterium]
MAELEHSGGRLYYEHHDGGASGAPPLVFVHGLTCAHEDWAAQVAHFAPTRTVVTLDLRGHGQSTDYDSGFDVFTMSEDVAALLGALDLPPVVLVGHSMGCRMVLQTARIAPSRVAGVVLVDGSRFAAGDGDAARRRVSEQIDRTGYVRLLDSLFDQMFTSASDTAIRQHIIDRARRMPEATGRAL